MLPLANMPRLCHAVKGLDRRYAPLCDNVCPPRRPSDAGRAFFVFVFLACRASAPSQLVCQLGAPLAALDPELFGCHETVAGFAYTMLRPAKGGGGHEERFITKGSNARRDNGGGYGGVVARADSCIE